MTSDLFVRRTASFSADRRFRFSLLILWGSDPIAGFVGLNPSTADEFVDDPTVRRCRGFAEAWGCGGLLMLNAFAFRATDPRVMLAEPDPIGAENSIDFLNRSLAGCKFRVAAWGKHGSHMGRGEALKSGLERVDCLRKNGDGSPQHPLYLPKTLTPIPFNY